MVTTSRVRSTFVVAALAILAVGCGGDDDDAGAVADIETSSPAASLTPSSAPTTDSTTVPASTAAPTTAVPTSTAPPTTVDPLTVARAEVEAAHIASWAAWDTCLQQLPACDLNALGAIYTDTWLADSQELARGWNEAGYMARNIEDSGYIVENITLDPTLNSATVAVCYTDGIVIYYPSPDGVNDQIISDRWVSGRDVRTFHRQGDGTWRATLVESIAPFSEGRENNQCD